MISPPFGASLASWRRRVDWPIILQPLGRALPAPKVVSQATRGKLASLLSAFHELLALDDTDVVLRRAVEIAREQIGLPRVGIFLLDRSRNLMLGTWGSDLRGNIVDEHQIMYAVSDPDREAFRRVKEDGARFTVFDDCPILEHRGGETKVVGRGWVAWTPILLGQTTLGMMFNDTGLSGAPAEEIKQVYAALLCSVLGAALDPARRLPGASRASTAASPARRLVTATISMLAEDPEVSRQAIAKRLDISFVRIARLFKKEMGMSLVEYRNRLRLDRFDALLDKGQTNLLEAALAAGFGSYAQFHRVFRSIRRMSPRDYLYRRTSFADGGGTGGEDEGGKKDGGRGLSK